MKTKELEAEKDKLEERLQNTLGVRQFESNPRWLQLKSLLEDKYKKREWLIKYLTLGIAIIAIIISIIALFKP